MKKIIIILVMLLNILNADENVVKVVLDLTTSDVKKFERTILKGVVLNKSYYEGKFQELEVVVIVHGGAYKFFKKQDKELLKLKKDFSIRIKSLVETYNVKIFICQAGMNARGLKKEDMHDSVQLSPNAMITLIDTQNNGFAYVPVR